MPMPKPASSRRFAPTRNPTPKPSPKPTPKPPQARPKPTPRVTISYTPYLELNCVSWFSPDFNMKFRSLTHTNALKVMSVEHFVNSVILAAVPYGHRTIKRIRIFGHGSPGCQEVGGSDAAREIKIDTNGKFVGLKNGKPDPNFDSKRTRILGRLRPYLHRDAVIELHGCKVGQGKKGWLLLKRLYQIWGVRVEASTASQVGPIPGREGIIRSYGPRGKATEDAGGILESIATTINNYFVDKPNKSKQR